MLTPRVSWWLLIAMLPVCVAADSGMPTYSGRVLQDVLEALRGEGLPLVYSTDLVNPDLVVLSEPTSGDPATLLKEILAPHSLTAVESGGSLVIVRKTTGPAAPVPGPEPGRDAANPAGDFVELEEMSVSASRYVLVSNSQFFIDQAAIRALPDLGEDPIRSAHRLPGAAAGGLSSKSHFRGGEHNETAIYLNGLKLLDPFHIRDYHSIFSSIDARAISGIEAYTGGFPADYGDQMSGVLLLDSMKPDEPLRTELGLSVYNTSILNSGFSAEGTVEWLVSARNSNLDIILDEDIGEPDYFDVFTELGIHISPDQRFSINALYADDQVVVITESDPEELEKSVSDTQNHHLWLTLDSQWTTFLESRTVLSWSELNNSRVAEANDPERMLAHVVDEREAEILAFQQDWTWSGSAQHTLRFGFAVRREEADYDYRARAEYLEFFEFYPGIENPLYRRVSARPEGNSYSAHVSDRWRWSESSALELGFRWDRQTYTGLDYSDQLSPRVSFLYSLDEATDLRFSWGRYHQSQGIQELQVEDGLDRFFEPQRSDHWIAGIHHRFDERLRLRVEAYVKNYDKLKPRFENLYDPLALIPELAPDRIMLLPESARASGLETTLEFRGGEQLDWWLTWSWSRVADHINGVSEPRSWDQRHALLAGLAWERGPWQMGVSLSIHTGWPTTGMNWETIPGDETIDAEEPGEGENEEDDEDDVIFIPVPGPRNQERLGTFAQVDFRVSREFPVKTGRLRAFFEVSNLTNRDNPCCIDFDLDEDEEGNVFLDRAVEHWLPIIPAVGITWEF